MITSTIEPIEASPRRTWSRAPTPAHSADSTPAAWQTSIPSAASQASAEVCTAVSGAACVAGSEAAGGGGLEAVGMGVVAEEATGNRICGGKQFLSKKTGMEVSKMARVKENLQRVHWRKTI